MIALIDWVAVTAALPDADTTVLVFMPEIDETMMGHYDGENWVLAEWRFNARYQKAPSAVSHWAEMPAGPNDQALTIEALEGAERFLSGFEDCEDPEDRPRILPKLRRALALERTKAHSQRRPAC